MTSLRVATYNLYLGADLSLVLDVPDERTLAVRTQEVLRQLEATSFPARARGIARLLAAERPDLVGLQEVTTWRAGQELLCDYPAELTAALEELGEPYDAHALNPTFSGTGRISADETLAVQGADVVLRRRSSPVSLTAEHTHRYDAALRIPAMGGQLVTISRGWSVLEATVEGSPFTFVATHTEAYDAAIRDAQRDQLAAALADVRPLVLVGDLNATPEDVGMPSDLVDAWPGSGGDPAGGLTCCQEPDLTAPHPSLRMRIDYVWARGLRVTGCRVLGDREEDRLDPGDGVALWPSDHAGVVADLVLPASPS